MFQNPYVSEVEPFHTTCPPRSGIGAASLGHQPAQLVHRADAFGQHRQHPRPDAGATRAARASERATDRVVRATGCEDPAAGAHPARRVERNRAMPGTASTWDGFEGGRWRRKVAGPLGAERGRYPEDDGVMEAYSRPDPKR